MNTWEKNEEHVKTFGSQSRTGSSLTVQFSQHVRHKGKPVCSHLSDGGREANRLARLRKRVVRRR